MKLISLVFPTLLASAVVGFLLFDENPTTNVDAISAAALNDHISSGAAIIENSNPTFPITTHITREYLNDVDDVAIRAINNGNAEGFQKFCRNEVSMVSSSRPILQDEIMQCNNREIRYIEIPIGMDATVIVTNRANPINTMTIEQLRTLWEDNDPNVTNWNEVNPNWNQRRIDIFGPSLSSNESVQLRMGLWSDRTHTMRDDYTQLNSYTEIVSNLATNNNAISFMSLSSYREFADSMKIINVNNVSPNTENIQSGLYPLSNYLFLYVNPDSIVNPTILEYVQYYIQQAPIITDRFGYTPLTTEAYELYNERVNRNITGTAFLGRLQSGTKLRELMTAPLCCGITTYPTIH